MRLVRVVTSVPVCATTPTAREHFAPLSPTSYVHNGTPRTHCKYRRQALLDLGRENREKSLPYSMSKFCLAASILSQALKALNDFVTFSAASVRDAVTGLSSQRGSKLAGRYPWSLSRSPGPSKALALSARGTPRGVRLRSHPAEHRSRDSSRALGGTHTLWSCGQGHSVIYYRGPFRVRTSYTWSVTRLDMG